MVWVKEKGKVPAREFRVAREIRRFEFLPRPTRGLLGNDSRRRNTPRQFDRLFFQKREISQKRREREIAAVLKGPPPLTAKKGAPCSTPR
jgi:hypothetical protein